MKTTRVSSLSAIKPSEMVKKIRWRLHLTFTRSYLILLTLIVSNAFLIPSVYGQKAQLGKTGSIPSFIQVMAGSWDVETRMWPGEDMAAIKLSPAIAHRRIIENTFLEETMKPAGETTSEDSFSRISYLNYNRVNKQYEYYSIDSRLPQMMFEKTFESSILYKQDTLILYGTNGFVAPVWGDKKNVAFRYRLTISPVKNNQQIVRIFLTPTSAENAKEFLAFEYVYTRKD